MPDDNLGWRLHLFDMATTKALALGSRMETWDYVEIVELSRIYPLEAIIRAACGKHAGFNPLSLFQMVMRFARIDSVDLDKIKSRHLDPGDSRSREHRFAMANTRVDLDTIRHRFT